MLYLRGSPHLLTKCFHYIHSGSIRFWWFFLIRVDPFYLVPWFYRVFLIVSEMSSISIFQLIFTQWNTFNNFDILEINQSPNCLQIPCSGFRINERIHCDIQIIVMKIFVCWSRRVVGIQGSFHTEIDEFPSF